MNEITTRPPVLTDAVRQFLAATRFATIATIDSDGSPHQAVVWYRLDGDEIVLNSAVGRRWPTNLQREPRLSIAITDAEDGYRWVGLTGNPQLILDQAIAQADIAEMARRYHAHEPDEAERLIRDRFERQERVTVRLTPLTIQDHLE